MEKEKERIVDQDQEREDKKSSPFDISMEELARLFPNALRAFINGTNIYLVHLKDGQRAAIFFDKTRGCYVIEMEGKEPVLLLDKNGHSVKTLQQLYEVLKGITVEPIRGKEQCVDIEN